MLGKGREIISAVRGQLSRLNSPLRVFAISVILIVVVTGLLWLFDKIIFFYLARSYVDEVAYVLDVNRYLANAIAWVAFAVTVYLAGLVFSLSKAKRRAGLLGLLVLLVGQSLILWYGTSGQLFDRSGKAVACYVITRDAAHPVRYGNHPGTVDPDTGRLCRPVTPEMVERLRAYEKGDRPKRVEESAPVFFDPRTGEAIVWYYKNAKGEIELFNLMGFHPSTGEELTPVSKEIAALWNSQSDERKKREARRAPERIADPEAYEWFDPITGEPRVWYVTKSDGNYEFFDRPGFYPSTGEALAVASTDVRAAWLKTQADKSLQKCYVITRDASQPVRYGNRPGAIDPETGRLCRPVTSELIERLRAYEKGERPKRIEEREPVFFDPRTGEAVIWYYKNSGGDVELFNLMGFHPGTGEELMPVTKEIYELWKKQQTQRIPKEVDLSTYSPFDPKTGQPRVWYWRSAQGEWKFYDSPGFQPATGEALTVLTKGAIEQARAEAEAQKKRLDDEQAAREKAKRERTEREEQDKRDRAKSDEENRIKLEAQRRLETEAANRCDQLAGSPTDPKRSGAGVAYDLLKPQAPDAVQACEAAIRQYPNELRFQYQLGRALEFVDRKRAFEILDRLAKLQYPAAFDNLGWLYITFGRNNYPTAVALFRKGTSLGDPDSMVSLAEMIDRKQAVPTSQQETKMALYSRAAAMGHPGAARALEVEQEKERTSEQQLEAQQKQQQMMMQLFGTVLQNVGRR